MRLEHVDLSDHLVIAADERWPNSTWSAVLDYSLELALDQAARDDEHAIATAAVVDADR